MPYNTIAAMRTWMCMSKYSCSTVKSGYQAHIVI